MATWGASRTPRIKLAFISDSSDDRFRTCAAGQRQAPALSGEVALGREGGRRRGYDVTSYLHARSFRDNQAFACLCMPGRGRKLVAIQTEARTCQHCVPQKTNTYCALHTASRRHGAAGRERESKKCRRQSDLCSEPSCAVLRARIPNWVAAPTALQTHCLHGRPQDFVAGTRVPGSGLPRVFVRALACICMQRMVVAAA